MAKSVHSRAGPAALDDAPQRRSTYARQGDRMRAQFSSEVRRRTLLAAIAGTALTVRAQGQKFPERPVKIVVPQPPGGAADRLGRMLGDRLEALWKQSVVLENKPGGGVVIGTQAVARAP